MRNLLLILVTLLSACGTVKTQYVNVEKFIEVPAELTKKVSLSTPFDPVGYSVQDWGVQEGMLFELIQTRTTEVGICNARLNGVNTWSLTNSSIYNSNKKE